MKARRYAVWERTGRWSSQPVDGQTFLGFEAACEHARMLDPDYKRPLFISAVKPQTKQRGRVV